MAGSRAGGTRPPDYETYDYSRVWKSRGIEDLAEREIVSRWAAGETGVELGGGFGRITQVIEQRVGQTFMLDYSLRNLRAASTRLHKTTLVRTSLDRLPFDDSVFDFVALIRVMQHMPDPYPLLSEIVRVGRDGATFVLGIANQAWPRSRPRVTVTETGHTIYSTPLKAFGYPGLERMEVRGVGVFDNLVGRALERLSPLAMLDVATSRLWPAKSMLFVRYRVRKQTGGGKPHVKCRCGGSIQGTSCERCGRSYGEIIDLEAS
jgi:SAM-dependent methyltransferase